MERFVAIDVETASRSPTSVCAVGAVRFERGVEAEAFKSLVFTRGRVRFGRIHGISAEEIAGAPEWPAVWDKVMTLSQDIREFVAYRAAFDRGAILAMCAQHGVRLPRLHFTCAAEVVARQFPGHHDLSEALRLLGLSFSGRHHDPLADARAAAAIVVACSSIALD
jgi:DNA polymerase-3 subunit epsilon